MKNVDQSIVPNEYKEDYGNVEGGLKELVGSFQTFQDVSGLLKIMLGENAKRKYLIVFQNNNEIRPTGGFIGSFAEITIDRGEISSLTIPNGGSYDLQGALREYLTPPEPLRLVNYRWEFQDANWFPDFPTSAKKLIWFFEQSGGPTVDGVIAINATAVESLLRITGPIEMPDLETPIHADNFLFETQKIIELEHARGKKPKQFLADFAPRLLERVWSSNPEELFSIANLLNDALSKKEAQIFLNNQQEEKQAIKFGWAGEIKSSDNDYLMVVNTNVGGGKTDLFIKENIDVDVSISDDGSVTNSVTITRTHEGNAYDQFGKLNNVDFVRLYVPRGSELIDAQGFEIPPSSIFNQPEDYFTADDDLVYTTFASTTHPPSGTLTWEESGKTVFGNWVQTAPGETERTTFTYKLPWRINLLGNKHNIFARGKDLLGFHPRETYQLLLQKQSGANRRISNIRVHAPNNLNALWTSMNEENGAFNLEVTNKNDAWLGILFERDI